MTAPRRELPLSDWSAAPLRAAPPPFAIAQGLGELAWGLIAARFPEAAADPDALGRLLSPRLADIGNPFAMPGVRAAADRLAATIDAGGEIVVYGDFDADGVTATAILSDTIRACGGRVRPFLPRRAEGYGLGDPALSRCLEGGLPALLVAVDCGIASVDAARRLLDAGCGVVVADHHVPGDPLPPACVVVAPHLDGTPDGCRHLCGAGVAFLVACGLVATRHPRRDAAGDAARRRLFAWLDALAVATVADVVPLVGLNRLFVTLGLARLNDRPRVGLRQLVLATLSEADADARSLGFILGPHINSAGRMASADIALQLLLAEDVDTAREAAAALKRTNALRKGETARVDGEAAGQVAAGGDFDAESDGAVVVAGEGWHAGVIGLVAAHLCERLSRPAVVCSLAPDGGARGSVRAPEGYDAYAALAACAHLLRGFGGHAGAAGVSLDAANLPAFRRAFADACRAQVGAVSVRPSLDIAGWLEPGDIDAALLDALHRLEPFGEGNPEPAWGIRGVSVTASPLGHDESKGLRLALRRDDGIDLQGLWFGGSEFLRAFDAAPRWDVAGTLLADSFGGERTVKLRVVDARPSRP